MGKFSIPSSLLVKSAEGEGEFKVGGVASSFDVDLDGEAITSDAVRRAIPQFMAPRGPSRIQGGPIKLHHGFYERFIKNTVNKVSSLSASEKAKLATAVVLPLGRVSNIWVGEDGVTYWEGYLSKENPVSSIIWRILKEGLVHLGVSLGGLKNATQENGRDSKGKPCRLITDIRLDELSVTDNPALRSADDTVSGAYIHALVKSLFQGPTVKQNYEFYDYEVLAEYLLKSLSVQPDLSVPKVAVPISKRSPLPRGSAKIQHIDDLNTGIGVTTHPKTTKLTGQTKIATDSYLSVGSLAESLYKTCSADRETIGSKDFQSLLQKAAEGFASVMEQVGDDAEPLAELIQLLRYISKHAAEVPYMDDWRAGGVVPAISETLRKGIERFTQKFPKELMGTPVRPPTSGGHSVLDFAYPDRTFRHY